MASPVTSLCARAVTAPAVPSVHSAATSVSPPSRVDLILIDTELREHYRAATLLSDGRSRRGRKTKHDTATRRWIDTVGFPSISMGKIPAEADMAMLRLSPRSSLSGANLITRDAWSQLHGRDPRSKKQTAAEKQSQQTLLSWARANMTDALTLAAVRRGRATQWKIDFGTWTGYTPMQLALGGAAVGHGAVSRSLPQDKTVPAGKYLTWITGQDSRSGQPFKWRFPSHMYLYLAMRQLEAEGRMVKGYASPILLKLPAAVHQQYEKYVNIRLMPSHVGDEVAPPVAVQQRDGGDGGINGAPAPNDCGGEPTAGALRAPPPPQPVDHVESATLEAQVQFSKGILADVANKDRPEYEDWEQLTVRSPPHPTPSPSHPPISTT